MLYSESPASGRADGQAYLAGCADICRHVILVFNQRIGSLPVAV